MMTSFELENKSFTVNLPGKTTILKMKGSPRIDNPQKAIRDCLDNPIGTNSFSEIIGKKQKENPNGKAVIVISDNTRPVPYRGEQGILLPLILDLMKGGCEKRKHYSFMCQWHSSAPS
jgi:nickel-dependent lactate racemase